MAETMKRVKRKRGTSKINNHFLIENVCSRVYASTNTFSSWGVIKLCLVGCRVTQFPRVGQWRSSFSGQTWSGLQKYIDLVISFLKHLSARIHLPENTHTEITGRTYRNGISVFCWRCPRQSLGMLAGPMLAKPQDLTFCDEAESPAICSTVESVYGYFKTSCHSCYPICQGDRVRIWPVMSCIFPRPR